MNICFFCAGRKRARAITFVPRHGDVSFHFPTDSFFNADRNPLLLWNVNGCKYTYCIMESAEGSGARVTVGSHLCCRLQTGPRCKQHAKHLLVACSYYRYNTFDCKTSASARSVRNTLQSLIGIMLFLWISVAVIRRFVICDARTSL